MQLEAAQNLFKAAKQYERASDRLQVLLDTAEEQDEDGRSMRIKDHVLIQTMEQFIVAYKNWKMALETEGLIPVGGYLDQHAG